MKAMYDERRECRMHEGEIAAVCARCYDLALEQQARQVRREQEQAHAQYLRERRAQP